MDKLISCWEKCLTQIIPLKTEDIEEGKEIIDEDSFTEFLSFCKEKGCFPNEDIYTLTRYGVCVYEENGNYFEEDYERREQLTKRLFG